MLTTSRAPLGLSSESVYLLPELDLPTTAELFGQRARAARPDADLPAERGQGAVRPPGRAAARRGAGRRAGPRHVGGRDRPPPGRPVRAAARRRTRRAAAAPHAARRHRLELEPARPGRAGGDARPVGVPRRFHRRRRPAPARAGAAGPTSCWSSSSLPTSRCSRSPTPRPGPVTGCWRPYGSSPPRGGRTPAETEAVIGRFLAWARDFGAAHHDFALTGDDLPAFELVRAEQDNLVLALRHGLDRKDGRNGRRGVGRAGQPVDDRVELHPVERPGRGHVRDPGAIPAGTRPGRGHPDQPGARRDNRVPAAGAEPGAVPGQACGGCRLPRRTPSPGPRRPC